MTSVLLLDNEEPIISTESLTPISDDCNESNPIPSPTGTFIDNNEKDAFLILKDTLNILPSPPPQEIENKSLLDKKKKRKAVKIEQDLDHKPLKEHDTPDCNWCQRCGTLETPRWRYGPAGPLSLCNACHLRWKAVGRPNDGYSSTTYPPAYHNVPTRKYSKSKKSRKNNNSGKENKRIKLEDNMIKLPSPPSPPPPPPPPTTTTTITKTKTKTKTKKLASSSSSSSTTSSSPPTPSLSPTTNQSVSTAAVIIPENCTQCHTTETPLWRRGPQGFRTLCNACGLKWAKEHDISSLRNPKKLNLLFNQKEFIQHGLYSNETRVETKEATEATVFKFSLPIHQGEFLLSTTREFELPPNIIQERDLGLIKGIVENREPCYTRIRSNIFVERKPYKLNEPAVCHCDVPKEKEQWGCGEDCINRMLFYECDPASCPCGKQCSNQRFQRKEKKKGLQVFQTDHRGWGLKTNVDIKKGELVIEYRGEIISHQLCEERMCTTYVNEQNFYFLDYCNGEVIDACSKGTEARFINHSCDPNCHIEKWSVKGESHYGVFASKDIKARTELFYDYNFSTFNGSVESQQRCHCGSKLCRGTIGKRGSAVARSK